MAALTATQATPRERTLRYFLLALLAVLAVVMVSLTLNGRYATPGEGSRASTDSEVVAPLSE